MFQHASPSLLKIVNRIHNKHRPTVTAVHMKHVNIHVIYFDSNVHHAILTITFSE